MTKRRAGRLAGLVFGSVLVVTGIEAAQRGWVLPLKTSVASTMSGMRGGALVTRPRASIGGEANGVYCAHPAENGVGVHALGAIPVGMHVVVTVESYTEGFDPVAAVIVPTLGQKAANTVRVATFYDNDSGGEQDARIDLVTPQSGNYLLVVGDFTDNVAGCYRYQIVIG
jgi:hypothetical protein